MSLDDINKERTNSLTTESETMGIEAKKVIAANADNDNEDPIVNDTNKENPTTPDEIESLKANKRIRDTDSPGEPINPENPAGSVNLGRRGDPRMHKAVAERLANPSMSLLEALIAGGFKFPDLENGTSSKSDRHTYDTDNILLCQRKNQLSRRLRLARKRRSEGLVFNTGGTASSDPRKKSMSVYGSSPLSQMMRGQGSEAAPSSSQGIMQMILEARNASLNESTPSRKRMRQDENVLNGLHGTVQLPVNSFYQQQLQLQNQLQYPFMNGTNQNMLNNNTGFGMSSLAQPQLMKQNPLDRYYLDVALAAMRMRHNGSR